MKPEQLKLYNKYKNIIFPDIEYIFIGIDILNDYWFIYKCEAFNANVDFLNKFDLKTKQIIKDLNFEIFIDEYGNEYIKGYNWHCFNEKDLINLKPILKDKLNNIINR